MSYDCPWRNGISADPVSLELNRGVGHDPGLAGLLRVYKEFYPEIVLGGGRQAKFEVT